MLDETPADLFAFLKQNELFQDLTDHELNEIMPFIQTKRFEKGAWLLEEGDPGRFLYLIKSGRAEILKEEQESKEPHLIGVLEPGDWVGEMAHLEKGPRSASVRAFDEVEAVALYLEELSASASHKEIYHKLSPKLTRRISQRLRKADDTLSSTLREKLELLQASNQVSKTIIYMLILFAVFFNIVAAYKNYSGALSGIIGHIFMPTSILLFGWGALRLIQKSGYPLDFYGLTLHKGWKIAFDGFLYTLPILALITLMKWALITNIPRLEGMPLLTLFPEGGLPVDFIVKGSVYILLVPLQEFIVRGFLQSSFRNFFQSDNRVLYAILSSNILFEVLHTANDLFLAIFSFIFGVFWGAMFEYQKSIIGVTVSHIMIGWWGIFALDILALAPPPVT